MSRPETGDRGKQGALSAKHLLVILGAMVGLYACGFVVFHFVWQAKDKQNQSATAGPSPAPAPAPQERGRVALPKEFPKRTPTMADRLAEDQLATVASPAPPAAPPSSPENALPSRDIPPELALRGQISLDTCWDASGLQQEGLACGDLEEFVNRLSDHLYLALDCAREGAEGEVSGTVQAGLELDWASQKLHFWQKEQTNLPQSQEFFTCLNKKFLAFPLSGLTPAFHRYHLSFSLAIDTAKKEIKQVGRPIAEYAYLQKANPVESRSVTVQKDRVRLREKPVDGAILGFLSTGESVQMIGSQEGWCLVQTRRGTKGWMVCWGLALE